MKKFLVTILTLAIMMVSCSMVFTSSAYATVELEFYYWSDEQDDAILPAIDAFNESQDEIYVTATCVAWSNYWDKLAVSLPAGSGPDIFCINALHIADYVNNGYVLDISDLFEDGTLSTDDYVASTIATYTIDGEVWAIPRDMDAIAVFYNKSFFDAAGIDYPENGWTWEEFVETAAALTDLDNNVYGALIGSDIQSVFYPFLFSNGGDFFDEDGNCVVNSEEAAEAVQLLYDVIADGYAPTVEDLVEIGVETRFISYMGAMVIDGSWDLSEYAEALGDDLGIVTLPIMSELATVSHSIAWAGNAATEYPDEVKTFLAYMAGYDAQVVTAVAQIPAYEGLSEVWAENYSDYDLSGITDTIAAGASHQLPAANSNASEIYNLTGDYFTVMLSTGEIEENLAALEDEVNALLTE